MLYLLKRNSIEQKSYILYYQSDVGYPNILSCDTGVLDQECYHGS